ncbi:imidazole glycerol phosphate synthase subunit HisH [Desulfurispira natronophila]|uniref:imidazole glycerol phosphate synthase subunit HisH n=1 Tax=Desulfurispira natronophila TaxID=682562 RepID=UPI00160E05E4
MKVFSQQRGCCKMTSKVQIGILDYGIGNLRSVQKAFEVQGIEAHLHQEAAALQRCDKLILPGVGAFGDCMQSLENSGLRPLVEGWIADGRPLLGICVGFQMLLECSHEFGLHKGLGIVCGEVKPFRGSVCSQLKIPQMGWNTVRFLQPSILTEGLGEEEYFYFVHSFYCDVQSPGTVLGVTDYSLSYCTAMQKGCLYGTQFHPEKSSSAGLKILKNFALKG